MTIVGFRSIYKRTICCAFVHCHSWAFGRPAKVKFGAQQIVCSPFSHALIVQLIECCLRLQQQLFLSNRCSAIFPILFFVLSATRMYSIVAFCRNNAKCKWSRILCGCQWANPSSQSLAQSYVYVGKPHDECENVFASQHEICRKLWLSLIGKWSVALRGSIVARSICLDPMRILILRRTAWLIFSVSHSNISIFMDAAFIWP